MDHIQELLNDTNSFKEKLKPFLFPIEERAVGYGNFQTNFFPDSKLVQTKKYKAIVRSDSDKLISIMPYTYQTVPNREVIYPVLDFLDKFDNKWVIDDSHSFVQDGRMRLQITFPDLIVNDGKSDVALSLFLHNSYNGVEGVRGFWGGIRGICTNGIVFGKLLGSFYHRHTSGIDLEKLKQQLESTSSKLPVIEERIRILQNIESNSEQLKTVEKKLGKNAYKFVEENFYLTDQSQYILLNLLTNYVSHQVRRHLRARYQQQISKIFGI